MKKWLVISLFCMAPLSVMAAEQVGTAPSNEIAKGGDHGGHGGGGNWHGGGDHHGGWDHGGWDHGNHWDNRGWDNYGWGYGVGPGVGFYYDAGNPYYYNESGYYYNPYDYNNNNQYYNYPQ